MSTKNAPELDLLGLPWLEAKDPRGRKRHTRTKEIAENVSLLRATGSTQEEIATRLILDEKTLRKYYSRELDAAPALLRQVLVEKQWAKAKEGNVSAAKFIREELERGEARAAKESVDRRSTPPAQRPERLGKKAEAQAAAEKVGGMYAPPEAPKLIN